MGAVAKANRNEHYYAVLRDLPQLRALVLDAISDSGDHGATRHELASQLRRPLSSICARVNELESAGLVVETGGARETEYGGTATVLRLSSQFHSTGLVQQKLF